MIWIIVVRAMLFCLFMGFMGCDHLSVLYMDGSSALCPFETRGGLYAHVEFVEFNYKGKPTCIRMVNRHASAIELSDIKLSCFSGDGQCIYSESHWRVIECNGVSAILKDGVLLLEMSSGGEVVIEAEEDSPSGKLPLSVFKNTSYCLLNGCYKQEYDKGCDRVAIAIICKKRTEDR